MENELIQLVVQMREAQELYFRNPRPENLKAAKRLEKEVDERLIGQSSLKF